LRNLYQTSPAMDISSVHNFQLRKLSYIA